MAFEIPTFPTLHCDQAAVERAYRIAAGDLLGNIQPYPVGGEFRPVLLAGLDYDTPWTRDAAINVWNGLGLTHPQVARDTLRIGYQAARTSLRQLEEEEFDPGAGLFRGPAVYGDGVAAYPDRYSPGPTSSILDWVRFNPHQKAACGYGLPMMTLSTNCVYAQVYRILPRMARELNLPPLAEDDRMAVRLRENIQRRFWNAQSGLFDYLLDDEGRCEAQEGLGHAFAILFGIASREQTASILRRLYRTPWGVTCVWPTFARYAERGGFGRHSGTIWPFINAFWAEAALQAGYPEVFDEEFDHLTVLFNRFAQCAEIYHPLSGEIYGGLQEAGGGESGWEWQSCARQSWSASAYLRMIVMGILGMQVETDGARFAPHLPPGMRLLELENLAYRRARLFVRVEGQGSRLTACRLDGRAVETFVPAGLQGVHRLEMTVGG